MTIVAQLRCDDFRIVDTVPQLKISTEWYNAADVRSLIDADTIDPVVIFTDQRVVGPVTEVKLGNTWIDFADIETTLTDYATGYLLCTDIRTDASPDVQIGGQWYSAAAIVDLVDTDLVQPLFIFDDWRVDGDDVLFLLNNVWRSWADIESIFVAGVAVQLACLDFRIDGEDLTLTIAAEEIDSTTIESEITATNVSIAMLFTDFRNEIAAAELFISTSVHFYEALQPFLTALFDVGNLDLMQWALDETGYAVDTLNGMPVLESKESYDDYRAPRPNYCAVFNGTTSRMVAGTEVSAKDDESGSYCCWIKTSTSTFQSLVSEWDSGAGSNDKFRFGIYGTVAGRLYFEIKDENANAQSGYGDTNIADGQWHHVGVAWNLTGFEFFVDGVSDGYNQIANARNGTPIQDVGGATTIGCDRNGAGYSNYFNGRMQDLRCTYAELVEADFAAIVAETGEPVYGSKFAFLIQSSRHYWMQENSTTTFYESRYAGSGMDLTGTSITIANDGPRHSANNRLGFTSSGAVCIPRSNVDGDTANDVLGNPLEFAGQCPYPISIQVPCFYADGTTNSPWIQDQSTTSNNESWLLTAGAADYTCVMRAKWNTLPVAAADKAVIISYRNNSNTDRGALHYDVDTGKFGFQGYTSAGAIFYRTHDGSAITLGEWQTFIIEHIASDDDNGECYVDGSASTGTTPIGSGAFTVTGLGIGNSMTGTYEADIDISHFAIYSKRLSGSQIANSATNWIFADEPELELMWNLQEGSGTDIFDSSGNGRHALISGSTAVAWSKWTAQEKDHCVEYGGRFDSGVFIPALLDGTLAADGFTISIPAGKTSPLAKEDRDPFGAAELVGFDMGTPFVAADDIQGSFNPNDTMFRRSNGDGSYDRLITIAEPATGSVLANLETYVLPVLIPLILVLDSYAYANELVSGLPVLSSPLHAAVENDPYPVNVQVPVITSNGSATTSPSTFGELDSRIACDDGDNFSVSMDIYLETTDSECLWSDYESDESGIPHRCVIFDANTLHYRHYSNPITVSTPFPTQTWFNLRIERTNGTTVNVYIDDLAVGSVSTPEGLAVDRMFKSPWSDCMNGRMANFEFHNTTSNERAFYPLQEGFGLRSWDISGGGNHITWTFPNDHFNDSTDDPWGNHNPALYDRCIQYGGRMAFGGVCPMLEDLTACANGLDAYLLPGTMNPYSLLDLDPFDAPGLSGYDFGTPLSCRAINSELLTPADSTFIRTDATYGWVDKIVVAPSPLTGQALATMQQNTRDRNWVLQNTIWIGTRPANSNPLYRGGQVSSYRPELDAGSWETYATPRVETMYSKGFRVFAMHLPLGSYTLESVDSGSPTYSGLNFDNRLWALENYTAEQCHVSESLVGWIDDMLAQYPELQFVLYHGSTWFSTAMAGWVGGALGSGNEVEYPGTGDGGYVGTNNTAAWDARWRANWAGLIGKPRVHHCIDYVASSLITEDSLHWYYYRNFMDSDMTPNGQVAMIENSPWPDEYFKHHPWSCQAEGNWDDVKDDPLNPNRKYHSPRRVYRYMLGGTTPWEYPGGYMDFVQDCDDTNSICAIEYLKIDWDNTTGPDNIVSIYD